MNAYIDIHNHSLFGVDDGADTIETTLSMLSQAKKQRVTTIILTPHYRHGMFAYPEKDVADHFALVKSKASEMGVKVYLGCEYHVNSEIIDNLSSGRCHTLADTDYVLTEYSFSTEFSYIKEYTGRLLSCGYIPVIAHVERYGCFVKKPELTAEISAMGAMIQVNADSVLGIDGNAFKKTCKKLLKKHLADIVASDAHDTKERVSHMDECYQYVSKKYGEDYAGELFFGNPMRIIQEAED